MWNDIVSLVLAGHVVKLRNISVQILLDEWKTNAFFQVSDIQNTKVGTIFPSGSCMKWRYDLEGKTYN